ncbi:MAG TPA: serine hydrolase domain-containing protein, partial [Pyrinomonadaceae bacterium]|nr:serine hydrolase domain-containing protein [Pyrinomonadaceae bacterium]
FIKMVANLPPNFAPGDSWSYGNTAYNLLGHIIEVISGGSYWQFVDTRIFRPLGMTATGDRDPKRIIPQRATGYEWEMNALVGRDYDLTDVFSAGAVVSTLNDLIKWDAALSSNKLLKQSSRDALWTPVRLNDGATRTYGLGWNIETLRGHCVHRHNGQTAGFAASIARYVDDGVSVIVLSNIGDIGLAGEIARGVAKIYIPSLSLRALKASPDSDAPTTEEHEALLRARLLGRALDASLLTPAMRSSLDTEVAKRLSQRLASYGALQSFAFVESDNANGERARRYKATFDQRIILMKFTASDDGKVASMILEEEEGR